MRSRKMKSLMGNICRSYCLCTMLVSVNVIAATPEADAYGSTYERSASRDILVTNVIVLDGNGGRQDGVDVLISDGKISSVGRNLQPDSEALTIDGKGRWVTPGLIDVHSHNGTFSLPFTDDSSTDISAVSTPIVADTWIEHAVNPQDPSFYQALAGGVTTIQILPGSAPLIGGRAVVVKPIAASSVFEMKFPGAPYGLKMACGENPKGNFGEKGMAPTSRQGEVSMMRDAWIKADAYRKKIGAKPDEDSESEPRDLTMETLAGVLDGDIKVHLHCYRASDIAVMLSVAREFDFKIAAIHHAVEAYKIPKLLRDNDTCVAVWSDWWGFKLEARDAIRENAAFVEAGGACVMLHSDSPFVGQQMNLEAAKAMAAGNHAGLEIGPETAITWITKNPARALGLDDQVGRIAVGYNADIVVWSGNPFSIYTKADHVFIDGASHYDRLSEDEQSFSDFELRTNNSGVKP